VNTFDLVFSDDGVLERSTIGKDEDCIGVTSFGLAGAGYAAAVGLETAVKGASNLHSFLEGLGAGRGGDRERSTLGHAWEVSICLMSGFYIGIAH
jgi:hypothetical protein